jgi:pSer/pThr/pTyr-binding forkhead associated (FHA) protein
VTGLFCNRCGHRNPDDANFCSSCGALLEHLAQHDCSRLVVKRGPNAGSRYVLSEGVASVGRHPDSDLFLDDVTVSRRHAEVRRVDDHYTVRDVGSLNGTYLNRDRIEDEQTIGNGDEIQVGKFRLIFLAELSEA